MSFSDWKPRRDANKRLPHGYTRDYDELTHKEMFDEVLQEERLKGGDPDLPSSPEGWVFPDPAIIPTLDEALDQLDAGISLRLVAEWYEKNTKSEPLSHAGLRNIWDRVRPNHPRKQESARKKATKRTFEERVRYNRSLKLAKEKRKLAATKKRIEKAQESLNQIDGLLKEPVTPVIEVPEIEYDFEAVPEEELVVFKPNPGPQTRFFASSEREVLYGGAAGGGKSYALIADPMRYFGNPNFNGIILRRTNDELRELIWKTQELYPQAWPGSKWSKQQSSWTFKAGGHMWFTYLERDEDVLRYQGQAFNYIGFDELTQHPTPFAWNYMRSRLRSADPTLPLFMRATTNPGGPGHGWVKRTFIDPAPPGKAFPARDLETDEVLVYPKGHAREGEPLFYRKFIQASLFDNPYLTEDGQYEANLLSLPEHQRRQLLDGDWTVADGAAFPEFRIKTHVCEPFDIPSDWMRFRSCDFGYSERQASAVHWYAVDPVTGILYVYRELYVNQKTGKELARIILELERGETIAYGVLDSSVWAVRGQTGPSIAEEMIQAGCRWRPSDRSQGSRIASKNRLHELLRVDEVNGKPGIIFFDTCRRIISDLPVIPQSKDDDDIDRKYPNDHAYDSIRYGIQTRPKSLMEWDLFHGSMGESKNNSTFRPASSVFGY